MAEFDPVAELDALARPGKGLPAAGIHAHVQRGGNRRALRPVAQPHAFELGRDDLGVVEHQRVAGFEQ